jgi:Helix-loop-helix DNA-binding domain
MMSSLSNTNSEGPAPTVHQLNTTRNELNTLMKSMQNSRSKPDNSESGSSNGGNNSDNSALVSLGNTSFGFNFDSEESNSKEGQNDSNDDSDGNVQAREKKGDAAPVKKRSSVGGGHPTIVTSSTSISSSNHSSNLGNSNSAEQVQAAAHAVASLESIAARSYPAKKEPFTEADNAQAQREALDRKRKAAANDNKDADSGGYNTDDDEAPSSSHKSSGTATKSTRKKMRREDDDMKREERNQREKERSFRISKQITELRELLASGGVVVPKGTKSSVLTEAASYIRMLQQHQYRSEMYVFISVDNAGFSRLELM